MLFMFIHYWQRMLHQFLLILLEEKEAAEVEGFDISVLWLHCFFIAQYSKVLI